MKTPAIWFFAGGEQGKGELNPFTRSFITRMKERYGSYFRVVEGIYLKSPFLNVVRGLWWAQHPHRRPERSAVLHKTLDQITGLSHSYNQELFLVASSYGSVIAAQAACLLAAGRKKSGVKPAPVHVFLGASMISKKSLLFRELKKYQEEGLIGTLIYDELQDEGDNSMGIGGTNRFLAVLNALGICFPWLTLNYKGPSFLNTDPQTGHIHRRRSKTEQKAADFIRVMEQNIIVSV